MEGVCRAMTAEKAGGEDFVQWVGRFCGEAGRRGRLGGQRSGVLPAADPPRAQRPISPGCARHAPAWPKVCAPPARPVVGGWKHAAPFRSFFVHSRFVLRHPCWLCRGVFSDESDESARPHRGAAAQTRPSWPLKTQRRALRPSSATLKGLPTKSLPPLRLDWTRF